MSGEDEFPELKPDPNTDMSVVRVVLDVLVSSPKCDEFDHVSALENADFQVTITDGNETARVLRAPERMDLLVVRAARAIGIG